MENVSTTGQLRRQGLNGNQVARLLFGGDLTRIRRGGYAFGDQPDTPEARHRQLLAATLPLLHPDAVLSHVSAAVLHGLPVWGRPLEHVHVTRDRPNGARRRAYLQVHGAPLDPAEVQLRFGWPVTTLARTVVDLGRTLPIAAGVAAADRALANGADPLDLRVALRRATGWPGIRRARLVVDFASAVAESPGESVSRVRMDECHLPPPVLQFEIRTADGVLVGRSDFAWPQHRTLGEYDGKSKYGRLLRSGEEPSEVVYREKVREDQLRGLDWQLVRWTTPDLSNFAPVADRIRRAFALTQRWDPGRLDL